MGRALFTNLDFNGNSAVNLVIGSLTEDPAINMEGYVYYNNVKKCLRLYSDGSWNSINDKYLVVENLPQTGKENIVYLVPRGEENDGYGTYSAYIWAYRNNSYSFCQISGYSVVTAVQWDDIKGVPDLLDCEVQDGSNGNVLHIWHRPYQIRN